MIWLPFDDFFWTSFGRREFNPSSYKLWVLHWQSFLETTRYSSLVAVFHFFFQAEDGIRDWSVTGVQTCALPISPWRAGAGVARTSPTIDSGESCRARSETVRACDRPCSRAPGPRTRTRGTSSRAVSRSEERRVGKGGRSRWSPQH